MSQSTTINKVDSSKLKNSKFTPSTTRSKPYGIGTETVYVETEVNNRLNNNNNGVYRGGCGGLCNGKWSTISPHYG